MSVDISPIKVIGQIFLTNISVGKRRSVVFADLVAFEDLNRTEGKHVSDK